jgi:hypothetical protein
MKRKDRITRTITISLLPELRELARRRAAELGVSFSQHMRALVGHPAYSVSWLALGIGECPVA